MKYKGFFKAVNPKPEGEYIELFVSDWNKEHWAFYVYISRDNYGTDIQDINDLITKLNYRDEDVYIELIDYNGDIDGLYHYVYDGSHLSHSEILNTRLWEIFEDKGNDHFTYFAKLNGSTSIDDLESAEYSIYNDWDEVLEVHNPDLYKALDEHNGFSAFDIPHHFNCQGFHEINDLIVLECC